MYCGIKSETWPLLWGNLLYFFPNERSRLFNRIVKLRCLLSLHHFVTCLAVTRCQNYRFQYSYKDNKCYKIPMQFSCDDRWMIQTCLSQSRKKERRSGSLQKFTWRAKCSRTSSYLSGRAEILVIIHLARLLLSQSLRIKSSGRGCQLFENNFVREKNQP